MKSLKRITGVLSALLLTLLLVQPSALKAENEKVLETDYWLYGGDGSINTFAENEEWVIDDENRININVHVNIEESEYADYKIGPIKCSNPEVIELGETKYYNNSDDVGLSAPGTFVKEGSVYYYFDVEKDGVKQTLKSKTITYRKVRPEITAFTLNDQKQFVKADTLKPGVTYYVSAMLGGHHIHEAGSSVHYRIETDNHKQDKYLDVDAMEVYAGDPYEIPPYSDMVARGGGSTSRYDLIIQSDTPKDIQINIRIHAGSYTSGRFLSKSSSILSIKDDKAEPVIPTDPKEPEKPDVSVTETTIQSIKDNESNILISGTLVEGTTLKVQKISENDIVAKAMSGYEKFEAFDLTLMKENLKVQPDGTVKVSIPIPDKFNRENIEIYFIDTQGTKTKLPHTVIGDYAVFETNHFSMYVIAEKTSEKEIVQTERKQDTNKTDIKKSNKGTHNDVNTGDDTNPLLYGGAMLSALGILIVLKLKNRKRIKL